MSPRLGAPLPRDLWKRHTFDDPPELNRRSVFAVLDGPSRPTLSSEPCWLVRTSPRGIFHEMEYDVAMSQIYPRYNRRLFVELPRELCPEDIDCDYSFVLAPRRVELPEDVEEDWRRRYLAQVVAAWGVVACVAALLHERSRQLDIIVQRLETRWFMRRLRRPSKDLRR
ncbi:hypothetical protein Emed_007421 [Eimeria media]